MLDHLFCQENLELSRPDAGKVNLRHCLRDGGRLPRDDYGPG